MNKALLLLPTLGLLACNSGQVAEDCVSGTCVDGSTTTGDGGATDGGATDGGATDGGATDGGGTDGGTSCTVSISSTSPTNGQTDVDLTTTVKFTLDDSDPTASVTLASLDGSSVAGSFSLTTDDTEAWFQADAPLSGTTDYVATLDWCGGTDSIAFTTVDPGEPVDSLIDNAYIIDLASATWVEPAGVGSLISGAITYQLLLGVSDVTSDTITMFGSLDDGFGAQDTCLPSLDFPTADFTANPFFQLGPTDISLVVSGYTVSMNNFLMTGSFSADASQIVDATADAELDARELGDLLGGLLGTTDPDQICTTLGFLGISCDPCSSDGASYCVAVAIENVQGDLVDFSMDVVDQADCHPTCDASWSNPDCDTSGF